MRKSNVGRNRLLAAVALIACLCMMILAGCTGVSRSADKPVLDEATVVRVVDGDTFVANIDGQDEKIRLIGVDTPESVNPDESKNTERGKEASENTKSILTKGKHVWLRWRYLSVGGQVYAAPSQPPRVKASFCNFSSPFLPQQLAKRLRVLGYAPVALD